MIECSDDDFFAEVRGSKYSLGSVDYGHIGEFVEYEDVLKAMRDWARANKYYPNLFFISDHGNIDEKATIYLREPV